MTDVYARYKSGEHEVELRGPRDWVTEQFKALATIVAGRDSNVQLHPLVQSETVLEMETPLLGKSNGVQSDTSSSNNESHKPLGICELYRNLAPVKQVDGIAAIAYFYEKYANRQCVTLEDFEVAYRQLKAAQVDTPANLRTTVDNAVYKAKSIYRCGDGKFALTIQGREEIEKRLAQIN